MPGRLGRLLTITGVSAALLLAACSGPDQFGVDNTTPVADPTPTATVEPTPEPEPTSTPTLEPTPEPSPTAEEPENTPTPSPEPTPEAEPAATAPEEEAESTEEPTAEPQQVNAMEELPRLEEMNPEAGYIVADQGERSADQLAQAYMDANAHFARLEEWGFSQHVYREFTRAASGTEDMLPGYVLATVNVYGSPEQADMAMQWIERSQVNQGSVVVDAPDIGEAAVAMTQRTSQGDDAAWVIFRHGDRVYIYYTQGDGALNEATTLATRVFERLANMGEIVWRQWAGSA